jgi:cytidylate kinase
MSREAPGSLVIAIDGPAGSGKSTLAKLVAKEFGLRYLDTGAMYRCVALLALRAGLGPLDGAAAAELAARSKIEFGIGDPQPVYLNGEEVTAIIRSLEIGELASSLSAFSEVRKVLVQRQREIIRDEGAVLEGRDTTTVVAPDADVKVFLDASLEERARRRFAELVAKGQKVGIEEIREGIAERDSRDSSRSESPLTIAEDAVVIDTTSLTIEQVFQKVRDLAQKVGT